MSIEILIGILIVVAFVGFMFWRKKKQDDKTNSSNTGGGGTGGEDNPKTSKK